MEGSGSSGSESSRGRTGVDEPLSATVVETAAAAATTTAKLHDQYCVRYEGNSSKGGMGGRYCWTQKSL
jgi:hypothetical protein